MLAQAVQSGRPLDEQEKETLGFTHCESGVILGKTWQLPDAICGVIGWHHDIEHAPSGNPLIALVHLGDLLCRLRGLGYGYEEWRAIDLAADPAWTVLARHCPKLANIDLARFTLDMDAFTTEGSEARVAEALSAGAKGYLRKPFTPEQVKERVAPLLGGGQ